MKNSTNSVNSQGMLVRRDGGVPENSAAEEENSWPAGFVTSTGMIRRSPAGDAGEPEEKTVTDGTEELPPDAAPEKALPDAGPARPAVGATREELKARSARAAASKPAAQQPAAAVAQQPPKQQAQAQPAQQPQPAAQIPSSVRMPEQIRMAHTPDQICAAYIKTFKQTLGLDLSSSICFENMRRMCEIGTKDPDRTLWFIENTYRVSTVLYLAGNLPILVVASILAEKNRKDILKYITTEIENASKPYDELKALRIRRWCRKYENMLANDAMTVTPGVTSLTPELAAQAESMFNDVCSRLRRFNREMSQIVSKFDDATRNDVVFIYSNWWHLLQCFENVPEIRTYLMTITDDTRRNLRI